MNTTNSKQLNNEFKKLNDDLVKTRRELSKINELENIIKNPTTEKQKQRVSDAAKYIVTALTASAITKRYLLAASLELKDLPTFQKKHQWLKNKLAELDKAHAKAFANIQKSFQLEGIDVSFDNDCDQFLEEFDKIVFEPVTA